jgi:hypothetical protein
LLSTTTSADTNGDSSALWPDVIEDESGDEESEKDSNDTIADVIEIGIGRIDFVGPSSMAEILRHRLSELREFTIAMN